MSGGFVYVLTNETMPGLVKIGKTRRLPTERSSELFTTGVAKPFAVQFAIFVEDIDSFEMEVHDELSEDRVHEYREFFRIYCDSAIVRIIGLFLSRFDCVVEHGDYVIDPGDHARYGDICGVHPPDVVRVIDEISICEWKAASARFREKRERRKAKLNQ